jgi:hypothetical protein
MFVHSPTQKVTTRDQNAPDPEPDALPSRTQYMYIDPNAAKENQINKSIIYHLYAENRKEPRIGGR